MVRKITIFVFSNLKNIRYNNTSYNALMSLKSMRFHDSLKHIYIIKRSLYCQLLSFISYVEYHKYLSCRYNILIISHMIIESNKQTILIESNKLSHQC